MNILLSRIGNIVLICTLIAVSNTLSFSQKIPKADLDALLNSISAEDWRTSAIQAEKFLKKFDAKDVSLEKSLLTYIDIFAHAGMTAAKQETFDELKQHVNAYVGQKVILPGFAVSIYETADLNKIHLYDNDTSQAFVAIANSRNTSVLCYCFMTFKEKINSVDYLKKTISTGGTIDKIEFNPKKTLDWILRLIVKDAVIYSDDKK